MIDRHWDGIAAYCKPENKVSLGFVEGLNNKIRVFQRRAYGLRDDEYLRLNLNAICSGSRWTFRAWMKVLRVEHTNMRSASFGQVSR